MEIQYRREIQRNELMIKPERPEKAGYEIKMLKENFIKGLLRFRIQYQELEEYYAYDITSRQSLESMLESRSITTQEISSLLIQLQALLKNLEAYLLPEDAVLLEPGQIYVDLEWFALSFCLVPGYEGNFARGLESLFQYLLKKVDHRDRDCVVLVYGLYQESQKESCSMEDLLRLLPRGITGEGKKRPGAELHSADTASGLAEGVSRLTGRFSGLTGVGSEAEEEFGGSRGERGVEARTGEGGWKTKAEPKSGQADGRKAPEQAGLAALLRGPLLCLFLHMAAAGGLWLLRGTAAFRELAPWLAGSLLVTGAGTALAGRFWSLLRSKTLRTEKNSGKQEDSQQWELFFAPEEEMEPENISPRESGALQTELLTSPEESDHFQTELLTTPAAEAFLCRLEGVAPRTELIGIGYVPFVIGKQTELVDYVLAAPGVSRLHLKISQEGGHYQITDLDSTNGTLVRGKRLMANEPAAVSSGDEIQVADVKYIFRE